MSLRLRLTLLYSCLLGGILLLFGVVVYLLVSAALITQVDNLLEDNYRKVFPAIRVSADGEISILSFPGGNITDTVAIQLWGNDGERKGTSANIARYNQSMDPDGLKLINSTYRTVSREGIRIRVLDVPLMVNQRKIGVLQLGSDMSLVDSTQRTLLTVIMVAMMAAITITALGSWFATGQVLSRLEKVTEVATQITHANDLSRRIPDSGSPGDEVTQLIHAFNQTLERMEKLFSMQRRFLADVSHELRTPLTVIKGNVGLMRKFGEGDEESLAIIESEVDRLTRMVGDLLLLAQAESGKIPLDYRPVELDTILLEVFQQMRILAGDRLQIRITEIDQVQVYGDRDRLKQVLVNLVGNAIKYTQAGGQISLSLSRVSNQARISIVDNGPGIPTEDLPHIFERFYRAEKSRKRGKDGSGFGLGLSIAYWIVLHHNGHIEVESTEGKGTAFIVYLPLEEIRAAGALPEKK